MSSLREAVLLPFNSDLRAIAITRDGSKLYAADGLNNTVSIIDASKNKVIATLNVGPNPSNIAITPDSSKVYVANSSSDTVSVIEVKTEDGELSFNVTPIVLTPKTAKASPVAITIKPDSSRVYVANVDTIDVINVETDKVIETIDVNSEPSN